MASSTAPDPFPHGYPSRHPPEVVAVLGDAGTAPGVARVAVDEAAQRGVPVRFLEVIGSHVDAEGQVLTEEMLFRAGLRALRGHPRTHSVFEVVRGHVGSVVRRRSHRAVLVVVGEEGAPGRTLASRCLAAAECPVRTVPAGADAGPGRGTFGPGGRATSA